MTIKLIASKRLLVTSWLNLFCVVTFGQLSLASDSIFLPQTIDDNIAIGYGLATGDMDGDKKQFVWYPNGDWKKFVMFESLTEMDNVCIAAEDLDGDGKVEVAVGGQWNPSETADEKKSGAVFYLSRPENPTQLWKAIKLYHEPTIHRMRWIKSPGGNNYLVVLPLHGKGNRDGQGHAVNLIIFRYPDLLQKQDPLHIIPTNMHQTHNLEIGGSEDFQKRPIYIAGKEGIGFINSDFNKDSKVSLHTMPGSGGVGEVRFGDLGAGENFIATIEPMHGHQLVIYVNNKSRQILDSNFKEGHALIAADVLEAGYDQLIAGWRQPDKDGNVGIKLFTRKRQTDSQWESQWIDKNDIACEDLQVVDLNSDGRMEILASGRKTHNLKIYWNNSKRKR